MKLSKFINLVERKGEKAHREAEAMGLKYKGFGYWVDPNTGQVTHKTEGDQLVAVEPDVETDKWQGGDGDEGGAMGPGGQMDKGGMSPMGNQPQMGMPMGSGQNIGTAEPGMAQVQKRLSWEPGPDGDTAVDGSEPPGDIPADAFVGKTNYYQWVAGPKGTNFKNLSYDNVKNAVEGQGVMEETEGAKTMAAGMMPGNPVPKNTTGQMARKAMDSMFEKHPDLWGKQVRSILGRVDQPKVYTQQQTDDHEAGKRAKVWHKQARLPAIKKDADKVTQMNDEAKPLFSDPNFDLDQFNSDESFGEGAFGQVFLTPDKKHVIKKGAIGVDELKALHAMRNNPNFPTLVNGRFDSPFMHQSSVENNSAGFDQSADSQGQYWDPDEEHYFDRRFPTAQGTYAMTRAKGNPLADVWDGLTPEQQKKAQFSFWRARAAMHQAGFSHNDMHGGNIFVDDDGNSSIIDLGMSKDDPLSALMEGLGGADAEQGQDTQLTDALSGASLRKDFKGQFDKNIGDIEQKLMDSMDEDPTTYDDYDKDQDYSPKWTYAVNKLQDMLRGDIRMRDDDLNDLRETLPFLNNRDNVMGLIKNLYKDVALTGLEKRMAVAYDKRKLDTDIIKRANDLRAKRGESPIDVKNRNVIPPQFLDYDD